MKEYSLILNLFFLFALSSIYAQLAGPVLNQQQLTAVYNPANGVVNDFDWQSRYGFNYYLTSDGTSVATFQQVMEYIYELDKNGNPACVDPVNCPYSTSNTNSHAILYGDPPETRVMNNVSANWANVTVVAANNDWYIPSPTPNCVPPGDSTRMCINLVFTNEYVSVDRTDVICENESIPVPADTIKSTFYITNWKFAPLSTGIRLVFMCGVMVDQLVQFIMYPNIREEGTPTMETALTYGPAYTSPCTPPCMTGFSQVNIQSEKRENEVYFPFYAILDNSPVLVNLTGPYQHPWDTQARVFLVDIPRFNTSMQYSVYARVKSTSEYSGTPSNSPYTLTGTTIVIIVASVGGFIICCCLIVIIHKIRKAVRRVTHHHDSGD
jgi:hypothetical protein